MRWFLVVLYALACGCGRPHLRAEAPLDPSKLELELTPDSQMRPGLGMPARHTWALLQRALAELDRCKLREDAITTSAPERAKSALEALHRAAVGLEWLRQASLGSTLIAPTARDSASGHEWPRIKAAVKLLIARGRCEIETGDALAGSDDLAAARKIGALMLAARGTMTQTLAGYACLALADRAIRRAALNPRLTAAAVHHLLAAVPPAPKVDVALQDALRRDLYDEIIVKLASVPDPAIDPGALEALGAAGAEPMVEASLDSPKPFDRRQTALIAAEGCAIAIRNLGKPHGREVPLQPFLSSILRGWPKGIAPQGRVISGEELDKARQALSKETNPLGKLIVANLLPTYWQFTDYSLLWRTEQEATRTLLAIRIWRDAHHGSLPRMLGLLVTPGLLSSKPFDFYADAPLHYDAATGRIWSVGIDGIDEGGTSSPELASEADLVWMTKL